MARHAVNLDATKARYAFVLGDLRRVHRTALAAQDLLQELDRVAGIA